MSTKYRFTENEVPHFITMPVVEWVDQPSCLVFSPTTKTNLAKAGQNDKMELKLEEHIKIGFYTATILNWKKLLKPDKYKEIVLNSLRFLVEDKRVTVYGFVIIPHCFGTSCQTIFT